MVEPRTSSSDQLLAERQVVADGQPSIRAVRNTRPEVDATPLSSDTDFLCGVALSVYQNAGDGSSPNSRPLTNWGAFERQSTWLTNTIAEGGKCGVSNNFWELYEEDIQRAAELNVKLFRLSLEWSRIQPAPHEVDLAAVQHYHDIFDALDRAGMQSTVTLYHFVHPQWFDDMGHFEKGSNVHFFAEYATIVYEHFGQRTNLWATFNEINVQAFCSYVYGSFPPAKLGRFGLMGTFVLNCLKAHIAAYEAIKSEPGGGDALVGLVHNFMTYQPLDPLAFSAMWVSPVVEVINKCWGNDWTIKFLSTGHFTWPSFFSSEWHWQYPSGRPPCDWVGVNYYGRGVISPSLRPTSRPEDLPTDMPFAAYAPGLYDAIAGMAQIGIPMYITETGICDHTARKRPAFFESHFDQVVRAVEDGYDVRGITVWTLVTNFEWAYGWTKDFGLYKWSPDDPTNARVMHDSTKVLADLYSSLPARVHEARSKWNSRCQQLRKTL